jgi:hypothetical protein
MIDYARNTRDNERNIMTANPHPNSSNEYKILNIIREHYEEGMGELISHNIRHVLNDRTYIVHLVLSFEGDDEYRIHTETLRVDFVDMETRDWKYIKFTLLSEHDLDLTAEL